MALRKTSYPIFVVRALFLGNFRHWHLPDLSTSVNPFCSKIYNLLLLGTLVKKAPSPTIHRISRKKCEHLKSIQSFPSWYIRFDVNEANTVIDVLTSNDKYELTSGTAMFWFSITSIYHCNIFRSFINNMTKMCFHMHLLHAFTSEPIGLLFFCLLCDILGRILSRPCTS